MGGSSQLFGQTPKMPLPNLKYFSYFVREYFQKSTDDEIEALTVAYRYVSPGICK